MSSSRPWSPITQSSIPSITQSSIFTRPPSRIRSSSRTGHVRPPSRSQPNALATMKITPPRSRPKTPSNIPAPSIRWRSFSDENGCALSPTSSTSVGTPSISGRETPGDALVPQSHPPSRSMIPIPSLKFSPPSRSASAMSDYFDFDPSHNPLLHDTTIKTRLSNQSRYQDARKTPKPTMHTLPPSSFRDGMSPRPSMAYSRPGSRTGAHTPAVPYSEPRPIRPPSNPSLARMFWLSLFGLTVFFVSLAVFRILRFFWRCATSPLHRLPTIWLYGNVREIFEAGQAVVWEHWTEIYGNTFNSQLSST
jgi:hypothetical protein